MRPSNPIRYIFWAMKLLCKCKATILELVAKFPKDHISYKLVVTNTRFFLKGGCTKPNLGQNLGQNET